MELELEVGREWCFTFEGIFARAFVYDEDLCFYYLNRDVVDGHHLALDDLVKIHKDKKRYGYGDKVNLD
ncbi:MAG: hypothetical protein Q8P81_01140 [Nanoarchaeota archaeon]|nr:hypothetical protein [Nanoarchaeota archaeon]